MIFRHFKRSQPSAAPIEVTEGEASRLFEQNDYVLRSISSLSLQYFRQRLSNLDVGLYPILRIFGWIQRFMVHVLRIGPVPRHLSFIMDGNRRYAKRVDKPVKEGHKAGGATLIDILYICKLLKVSSVSAYAFSIENFNRSPQEVETLMDLLGYYIDEFTSRAIDYKDDLYGIKLRVVGELSLLNEVLLKKIRDAEHLTRNGTGFVLYLALPYTSRNDIAHSMQSSIADCINSNHEITEQVLTDNMYFGEFSNKCDLLIRTSGHTRLSDYMLWQVHENSVIEFVNCLWPDFGFWRLYWLILKWGFFQTWQQAMNSASSEADSTKTLRYSSQRLPKNKPGMFARLTSDRTPIHILKRTKRVALDSLPAPPLAVSVDAK